MRNPTRIIKNFWRECVSAWRLCDGPASKYRLCMDYFLLRKFRFTGRRPSNAARLVRFKGGIFLNYRLNEGDMQGIREVWFDECYRMPDSVIPKVFVDLGGNIGLTSIWMAKKYSLTRHIVVEADATNAAILRLNLDSNHIVATVFQAAVGPTDGVALFSSSECSNLGQVIDGGNEVVGGESVVRVAMVSMPSVLKTLPAGEIVDLLKMDIEGGEEALISGDLQWLDQIKFIITELHPPQVDCERIITEIVGRGMKHHSSDSLFRGSMTCFERLPD